MNGALRQPGRPCSRSDPTPTDEEQQAPESSTRAAESAATATADNLTTATPDGPSTSTIDNPTSATENLTTTTTAGSDNLPLASIADWNPVLAWQQYGEEHGGNLPTRNRDANRTNPPRQRTTNFPDDRPPNPARPPVGSERRPRNPARPLVEPEQRARQLVASLDAAGFEHDPDANRLQRHLANREIGQTQLQGLLPNRRPGQGGFDRPPQYLELQRQDQDSRQNLSDILERAAEHRATARVCFDRESFEPRQFSERVLDMVEQEAIQSIQQQSAILVECRRLRRDRRLETEGGDITLE